MAETRINLALRVSPELYARVLAKAKLEKLSINETASRLLLWALTYGVKP